MLLAGSPGNVYSAVFFNMMGNALFPFWMPFLCDTVSVCLSVFLGVPRVPFKDPEAQENVVDLNGPSFVRSGASQRRG